MEAYTMKTTMTKEFVESVKSRLTDQELGDLIVSVRTIKPMIEMAERMINERLDAVGFVKAGCGSTITRKIQRGAYSVPDPVAFFGAVRALLPEDSIPRVYTPSVSKIKDEIATVKNLPKTSKVGESAETVFDAKLRPLCEQGERRLLVFQ